MVVEQIDGEGVLLRQALYRFCAAALLYPEPGRMGTLKQGAAWLGRNLPGAWPGPELRERLLGICSWIGGLNGEVTGLQGRWIALFGVSRTSYCCPYEGATVEPQQAAMLQAVLQREYGEAGLTLTTDDLPDHVGIELEYMSYLCGMELEAVSRDRDDVRRKIAERQLRFLTRHLCRWLPGLTERVRQAGGAPFDEVCAAAEQIVVDERRRLEAALDDPHEENRS